MSKKKKVVEKKEEEVIKFRDVNKAKCLAEDGIYDKALIKAERRVRNLKRNKVDGKWTARKEVLLGKQEALVVRIKELQVA